ncbi:MAG TPA: hypothetical protein VFX70_02310 [Mycobacteriales bacterium]|nr:hypothetical protein [Mycobacteriales bacterium]
MGNIRIAVAVVTLAVVATGLAGCGSSTGTGGGSGRAEAWGLVSATGRQVVIRYPLGGCSYGQTIDHRESPTRVVVTVRVRLHRGVCPAILILRTSRVTLTDPLGSRRLIDGSTGSPPPHSSPLGHLPTGVPAPSLPTTGPDRADGGRPPGH